MVFKIWSNPTSREEISDSGLMLREQNWVRFAFGDREIWIWMRQFIILMANNKAIPIDNDLVQTERYMNCALSCNLSRRWNTSDFPSCRLCPRKLARFCATEKSAPPPECNSDPGVQCLPNIWRAGCVSKAMDSRNLFQIPYRVDWIVLRPDSPQIRHCLSSAKTVSVAQTPTQTITDKELQYTQLGL